MSELFQPVFHHSLNVGKDGLFTYLAKKYPLPYTNNIINLRPKSYIGYGFLNLISIYDKRITTAYWTNDPSDSFPVYLDLEINYHFFVPSHISVKHPNDRYPVEIEVLCGMHSENLKTIFKTDSNNAGERTWKIPEENRNQMCRYFRYQMNNLNFKGERYFDMYDFELYGDLYEPLGLFRFRSYQNKKFQSMLVYIFLLNIN